MFFPNGQVSVDGFFFPTAATTCLQHERGQGGDQRPAAIFIRRAGLNQQHLLKRIDYLFSGGV